MIDVPQRLRRAIHLKSLSLVKRIVPKETAEHPDLLYNHDEDGNTSLHLAAQLGLPDIAVRCANIVRRKPIGNASDSVAYSPTSCLAAMKPTAMPRKTPRATTKVRLH
jgi:hypothetical protein